MKNALLKENKKALQFLHTAAGFDFAAPHTITGGAGKITFNQIKKLIPAGHVAALLVKPAPGPGCPAYRAEKLHYVKITASRLEPRTGETYFERVAFRGSDIDYYYAVCDFETARKHGLTAWYLVTQAPEHLHPPRPAVHDLAGRWALKSHTKAGDGRGNKWIDKMQLHTLESGDVAPWEYEPYKRYTPGTRSADLAAVIDKSGYLLEPRKAEQRCKLYALKKAKAAAALAASDFSALEARARGALADARGTLAGELLEAKNSGEMYAIHSRLYRLHWAAHGLELYENRKAAGKLASCDDVRETLENIIKKCAEVIQNENA